MVKSYNGWTASKDPKAIGVNPNWAPLGHKFPGGIKSGPVEVVMTWVVEQLHARVEKIDRDAIKDEWGYVYKQSANSPKLVSCHASGTAFDYNASRHPNGKRGTFTPAQVNEIHRIVTEAGVVHWLGDAKGTPDEMHFEIKGTEAQVAAAAGRLSKPVPAPTPEPEPEDPDMAANRKARGSGPNGEWWAITALGKRHIQTVGHARQLHADGLLDSPTASEVDASYLDELPTIANP